MQCLIRICLTSKQVGLSINLHKIETRNIEYDNKINYINNSKIVKERTL